jgi:hypothetical protein
MAIKHQVGANSGVSRIEVGNSGFAGRPHKGAHFWCHQFQIVEHPETVAERMLRFSDVVGRENVIAATDCGFGYGLPASVPDNAPPPFSIIAERSISRSQFGSISLNARSWTQWACRTFAGNGGVIALDREEMVRADPTLDRCEGADRHPGALGHKYSRQPDGESLLPRNLPRIGKAQEATVFIFPTGALL